jgi:hypothetical protein
MFDQWLIPGALGLLALFGALFAFSRKRGPKAVAAVPAQPVAELEPDFDLLDADREMPIDLAADAEAQPEASGAANEGESQFDMLRLFYLRGDSAGFEETARYMREHNADPELWRRVAEMGRMLAPENPLYADRRRRARNSTCRTCSRRSRPKPWSGRTSRTSSCSRRSLRPLNLPHPRRVSRARSSRTRSRKLRRRRWTRSPRWRCPSSRRSPK